jgi:hypothetical protein
VALAVGRRWGERQEENAEMKDKLRSESVMRRVLAALALVGAVNALSALPALAEDADLSVEAAELAKVFRRVTRLVGRPATVVPRERWRCRPFEEGTSFVDGAVVWLKCRLQNQVVEVRVGSGYVDAISIKAGPAKAKVFRRATVLLYDLPDDERAGSKEEEKTYHWTRRPFRLMTGSDEERAFHTVIYSPFGLTPSKEDYQIALELLEVSGREEFRRICRSDHGSIKSEPGTLGCFYEIEYLNRIYFKDGKVIAASVSRPRRYMDDAVAAIVKTYGPPDSESDDDLDWVRDDVRIGVYRGNPGDYIVWTEVQP